MDITQQEEQQDEAGLFCDDREKEIIYKEQQVMEPSPFKEIKQNESVKLVYQTVPK